MSTDRGDAYFEHGDIVKNGKYEITAYIVNTETGIETGDKDFLKLPQFDAVWLHVGDSKYEYDVLTENEEFIEFMGDEATVRIEFGEETVYAEVALVQGNKRVAQKCHEVRGTSCSLKFRPGIDFSSVGGTIYFSLKELNGGKTDVRPTYIKILPNPDIPRENHFDAANADVPAPGDDEIFVADQDDRLGATASRETTVVKNTLFSAQPLVVAFEDGDFEALLWTSYRTGIPASDAPVLKMTYRRVGKNDFKKPTEIAPDKRGRERGQYQFAAAPYGDDLFVVLQKSKEKKGLDGDKATLDEVTKKKWALKSTNARVTPIATRRHAKTFPSTTLLTGCILTSCLWS